MAITRRQRQVYDFIAEFVQKNGYSPSFEEIGQGLGLSSLATVHKHISNLEKKGLLTRDYNRSRSIDLLPPKGRLKQAMAVNTTWCCRCWAASPPASRSRRCRTTRLFLSPTSCARKKCSCSKCAAIPCRTKHILNGDYVMVEKSKTAHNGDIVVALVEGTDATLKRFYRDGENIRLQPSNATMQPIIVPAASVEIQGRVIGVLRKY